jgi:hypothetical protein
VAIFQHSIPFLQAESFQTHVGTIHRRVIGPLVHHNSASAYTSLTRHLPASTIECLHRPRYKLACFSHAISVFQPKGVRSQIHTSTPERSPKPDSQVRSKSLLYHHAVSIVTYVWIVALLRECNNAALSNCLHNRRPKLCYRGNLTCDNINTSQG